MPPILIGLTGGIGTGKSTVASALADHGAEIVSGDELGRNALEQSQTSLVKIRERFGDEVFAADGSLLRRELGKRVFASRDHVQWLTALTFPRIHELWKQAVERTSRSVVVFDAALIVEWGIAHEFDHLLAVTSSVKSVRQRLEMSGRLTAQEVEARLAMQVDPAAKAAMATKVITNDGSLSDLRMQVDQFWIDTIEPEIEKRRSPRNDSSS